MKPGTKPRSADLKLVTGNPGKRDFNRSEPRPDGEVVQPGFVKGRAAKIWKRLAPDLEAKNVLTSWDVDMFGSWCCLAAEFQGDPTRFNGSKMTSMRLLGESFGLSPPGRTRLTTSGGKERAAGEEDPASEFYGRPG